MSIIVSGVIATGVMSLFLTFLHRAKVANTDMVRCVGSLVTRSENYAFQTGTVLHVIFGVGFALLYALVVTFAPVSNEIGLIMVCMALGFFHGLFMALFFTIVVKEHHPLPHFRRAGFDVIIGYLLAHLIYGLSLGVCLMSLNFDPSAPIL